MVEKFSRDTLSDQILQGVDVLQTRYYTFKDTPSANPLTFVGNAPFWSMNVYKIQAPDQIDPAAEPLTLLELERMSLALTKRTAPMDYTHRRVDADETMFIHSGSARLYTEVGEIAAPAGSYVFITRGVGYRVVPDTSDFIALIFSCEENLQFKESEGKFVRTYPTLPFTPPRQPGQTKWEERLIASDWRVTAIRDYDPVWTNKVRGDVRPVFLIGTGEVPENNGPPTVICRTPIFHLEVAKRWDPLPFYHRNCNNTEIQFVHLGGGDRDTELGYRHAPVGTLNVFPVGIEHSVCSRPNPCLCMIWEVKGKVRANPAVPKG